MSRLPIGFVLYAFAGRHRRRTAIVRADRQRNGGAEDVVGIVMPLGRDQPRGVAAEAFGDAVRVGAGEEVRISAGQRGRVDTTLPFDELRRRSRINAAAEAADGSPEPGFSQRIRASLPTIAR
jgi:hypothetical protein